MQKVLTSLLSDRLFIAGMCITLIMAYAQMVGGSIGDKDIVLLDAQLMVSGKRLYSDILDTNPPLIFWLYTIPVYISHLTGILDYQVLIAGVLLLIVLSMSVSVCLIKHHPQFQTHKQQHYFILLLCGLFIVCAGIVSFADREHVMMVLIFPYILRLMPSLAKQPISNTLSIIIGLMAGIGFGIKPHSLIIFLLLQLFYIARERSIAIVFSIENILIYTVGLLYLLAVYVFLPEYFYTVLPMAIVVYPSFNTGQAVLIYMIGPAITLAVALAEFRPRSSSPYRSDILFGLLVCIPFVLYILINNGWGYTVYPLSTAVLFVVALLWWEFNWLAKDAKEKGLDQRRFLFGTRACMLAVFANVFFSMFAASLLIPHIALAVYPNTKELYQSQTCYDLFSAELHSSESRTYGVIGIDSSYWPKIARDHGAILGTQLLNVWPIKFFAEEKGKFRKKDQWIIDYIMNKFVADITNNKPQLFFVEVNDTRESNIVNYMLTYPDFSEKWKQFSETELSKKAGDNSQGKGCKFAVYKPI